MKKLLTLIAVILIAGSIYAGGLVTNTNHSGLYIRTMSRNASTLIDAVYFNPAGLTKLGNGIFVSLNNQSVWQTRKVTSYYTYLNSTPKEYEGTINAYFFPGIYAAANFGKLSVSAGFNPIGGGGGATYETGLPSFEMNVADLVPSLFKQLQPLDAAIQSQTGNDPGFRNVTGYTSDIFFEGTSIYLGYQGNISYAVNDILSVAVGARYVNAKNTYGGDITGVKVIAPAAYGGSQTPGSYLRFIAAVPGIPSATVAQLNGTAAYLDVATNVEVDVEQTGNGFTPILSANVSPLENLNIGLKYEFRTKLELTTKVFEGKDGGIFINGEKTVADMPAMFAAGVEYKPIDKFMVTGSFNYYFDKNNDYDGSTTENIIMIDKNMTEYAIGFELGLTDWLRFSAGYSLTSTGVNSEYQKDQRYSLTSGTLGGGIGLRFTPMIDLNIGVLYTDYKEGDKSFTHMLGTNPVAVKETYNKSNTVLGIGLDLYFGRK